MTDDDSTTDKLAQDVVEGRALLRRLLGTSAARTHGDNVRVENAGNVYPIPREIPFGEDDPHATKSLTLGG